MSSFFLIEDILMSPMSWFGKCLSLLKLSKPAHTVLCKHLHNIFIRVCFSAVNNVNSRCVCECVFLCSAAERRLRVCALHLHARSQQGERRLCYLKNAQRVHWGIIFLDGERKRPEFQPGLHSYPPPRLRLSAGSLPFSTRGGQSNRTLNTHAMTPSRVRCAIPESRSASLIGMINIVVIGDTFLNGSSLSPGRTLGFRAKAKSMVNLAHTDKERTFFCG